MFLLRLLFKNAFRHKLRTLLTLVGLVVAISSFGLLRTVVDAWYAGVRASSATRLVTRNSISLMFPLPLAYEARLRQVAGVQTVSYGNWFGGIYLDEKNFFPNFAVEPRTYLSLYPEYLIPDDQRAAFLRERKSCVVGRKTAERFGWKVGDTITLRGTIFPGLWEFVIRALYTAKDRTVDETLLYFHWDYLNQELQRLAPRRADRVGFYLLGVKKPDEAASVAAAVDATFQNSLAETLTETEKAFAMSFVTMTEAILLAVQLVSFAVVAIIMVVAANTMAMTARERLGEYAVLKTLGFGAFHVAGLVFGESLVLSAAGGLLGVGLTFPAARLFELKLGQFFPIFQVSSETLVLDAAAILVVGLAAGVVPTWRAVTVRVADGLRHVA